MKTIMTKVVKLDGDNEALRFTISGQSLDVVLTSQDGINGLKAVYEALLNEIINDEVTVALEDKDAGVTAMYQDVCREYVDLLKKDLVSARREVIEKGLTSQPDDIHREIDG